MPSQSSFIADMSDFLQWPSISEKIHRSTTVEPSQHPKDWSPLALGYSLWNGKLQEILFLGHSSVGRKSPCALVWTHARKRRDSSAVVPGVSLYDLENKAHRDMCISRAPRSSVAPSVTLTVVSCVWASKQRSFCSTE